MITGLLAALGVVVAVFLAAINAYPPTLPVPAHSMGANADGAAGLFGRVVDSLSYFTTLSNIVVAVTLLLLVSGRLRPTSLGRTLRMDALVMISVTGLVYTLLLASDAEVTGWQYLSNTLEHYVTPILAVLTFLIWGPRGWLRLSTVFTAMILPIIWLIYALIRGSVIVAYPYGFMNVANLGMSTTAVNLVFVVILGIVLGLVFLGLDKLLSRGQRRRSRP